MREKRQEAPIYMTKWMSLQSMMTGRSQMQKAACPKVLSKSNVQDEKANELSEAGVSAK